MRNTNGLLRGGSCIELCQTGVGLGTHTVQRSEKADCVACTTCRQRSTAHHWMVTSGWILQEGDKDEHGGVWQLTERTVRNSASRAAVPRIRDTSHGEDRIHSGTCGSTDVLPRDMTGAVCTTTSSLLVKRNRWTCLMKHWNNSLCSRRYQEADLPSLVERRTVHEENSELRC